MDKILSVVLNQAPEVLAQQLIVERLDNVGWFFVCLVLFALSFYGQRRVALRVKNPYDDLEPIPLILCWCLLAFAGFGLICNSVAFAESFAAPKAVAVNAMLSHLR